MPPRLGKRWGVLGALVAVEHATSKEDSGRLAQSSQRLPWWGDWQDCFSGSILL
jgi:hypothetical protein